MSDFNNGRKYYPCPGQKLMPMGKAKPVSGQDFGPLKEQPPPQAAQVIQSTPNTPGARAEIMPGIPPTALTRYDIQAAALAEIKVYLSLTVNLEDKKTFTEIKKAKTEVRGLRLKIQRREKELIADLNKKRKNIKDDATALVTDIKATEDHLSSEIKKWEDEQARVERIRLDLLNKNYNTLVDLCNDALKPGLSAVEIKSALGVLETTGINQEIFQEKFQDACGLLNVSIEKARLAHQAAVIHEEKQAELKRLELESERVNQVAWFNDNFGIMASLATMEEALGKLEVLIPAPHLAGLVETQINQARAIIDKTKALQPAVKQEPKPAPVVPNEKKVAPRPAAPAVSPAAMAQPVNNHIRKTVNDAKEERVNTIKAMIARSAPGSLELILSNGQETAIIIKGVDVPGITLGIIGGPVKNDYS